MTNTGLDTLTIIGFQVVYVAATMLLLAGWFTQFNRLSGRQDPVPAVQFGSLIVVFMGLLFLSLEAVDPFSEWNLLNPGLLRLCSVFAMTFNSMWLIINGTFQASLMLVIVDLKLKENKDDGAFDTFTKAKYTLIAVWMIAAIILSFMTIQNNQGSLLLVYILLLLFGVLVSLIFTAGGLRRAYKEKLGSRDVGAVDVKKNARRKVAAYTAFVIGYHIVLVIALIVDLALGAPAVEDSDDMAGKFTAALILYGICNRIFSAFELWFNWEDLDERDFKEKLEERRKDYKVISVERMIDDRIAREKQKAESNLPTVVSPAVLEKTILWDKDEYEPDYGRTRGYTDKWVQQEALRLGQGTRTKATRDSQIQVKKKHKDLRSPRDSPKAQKREYQNDVGGDGNSSPGK